MQSVKWVSKALVGKSVESEELRQWYRVYVCVCLQGPRHEGTLGSLNEWEIRVRMRKKKNKYT